MENWKQVVIYVMSLAFGLLGGTEIGNAIGARAGYRKGYDAGQSSLVVPKPPAPSDVTVSDISVSGPDIGFICVHWDIPRQICLDHELAVKKEGAKKHKIIHQPRLTETEFKAKFSQASFLYSNGQWCVDAESFSNTRFNGCGSTLSEAVKIIEKKLDGCGTVTSFGPEFDPHRGRSYQPGDIINTPNIDKGIVIPIPTISTAPRTTEITYTVANPDSPNPGCYVFTADNGPLREVPCSFRPDVVWEEPKDQP